MPDEKPNDNNLLIAVVAIILFSAIAAVSSALICDYVLNAFQNADETMALLITADGFKSTDKKIETKLNSATTALVNCRDVGYSLGVGCVLCGVAVFIRIRRQNAANDRPDGKV